MISVAGERVWPGAVELTTGLLLAGRTESSANTHDLKTSTISSIV